MRARGRAARGLETKREREGRERKRERENKRGRQAGAGAGPLGGPRMRRLPIRFAEGEAPQAQRRPQLRRFCCALAGQPTGHSCASPARIWTIWSASCSPTTGTLPPPPRRGRSPPPPPPK